MSLPRSAAEVSVPATSANLGPGFDCLGLALDLRDTYRVEVATAPSITVDSHGEGAAELPGDRTHLVASSLLAGLEHLGAAVPGLRLTCHNRIPQSRGMGSSAAAIVGGVSLAYALLDRVDPGRAEILDLAARIEGHPDNIAPAVLGGFTVSWTDASGESHGARLPVAEGIAPVLFVPDATSPTHAARSLLPQTVAFGAAVHNSARSAMLVAAMCHNPELLYAATGDRLHQEQRREAYPAAMALVDRLRGDGWAAVVSGAGPAVLALVPQMDAARLASVRAAGYTARRVGIGSGVASHEANGAGTRASGIRS